MDKICSNCGGLYPDNVLHFCDSGKIQMGEPPRTLLNVKPIDYSAHVTPSAFLDIQGAGVPIVSIDQAGRYFRNGEDITDNAEQLREVILELGMRK